MNLKEKLVEARARRQAYAQARLDLMNTVSPTTIDKVITEWASDCQRADDAEKKCDDLIKEIVVLTSRQRTYLIRQYDRIAELESFACLNNNSTE